MEGALEDGYILLVDDDRDDVELCTLALRAALPDRPVMVARDGVEALAFLFPETGAPPPLPSVVLLDVHMPRLDGLELLEELRRREPTRLVPIVMLSSSLQPTDVDRSYRKGANSYIQKPIDFGCYRKSIASVGAYWLGLNRTAVARSRVP